MKWISLCYHRDLCTACVLSVQALFSRGPAPAEQLPLRWMGISPGVKSSSDRLQADGWILAFTVRDWTIIGELIVWSGEAQEPISDWRTSFSQSVQSETVWAEDHELLNRNHTCNKRAAICENHWIVENVCYWRGSHKPTHAINGYSPILPLPSMHFVMNN